MNKTYLIIGAVLLVIAVVLVILFGGQPQENTSGGAPITQPSGDDAALKNLRIQ